MADRFLELSDDSDSDTSDDTNRTVRTFHEQEIQRLQEHRMTKMQLAEHGAAAASVAAAMEHQRDLVHLREKEVQRLHREKELQKLEGLSIQQHHQEREEDLQQEEPQNNELYRSGQQMVAAAVQSMKEDEHREKEMLEALERRAKAAKRLAILECEEEIAKHHLAAERARFEKLLHLQHHLHIEQQQRIASVQPSEPSRAGDHLFQGFYQQELDEIIVDEIFSSTSSFEW